MYMLGKTKGTLLNGIGIVVSQRGKMLGGCGGAQRTKIIEENKGNIGYDK